MKRVASGLVAAISTLSSAIAAQPAKTMETSLGNDYTDQNGMRLNRFDKDSMGAAHAGL